MKNKYPKHLERQYEKLISNVILRIAREMIPAIRREIKRNGQVKTDADFLGFLNTLLDAVREKIFSSDYLPNSLNRIFFDVQTWVNNQTVSALKGKKGVSERTIQLTVLSLEEYAESDITKSFINGFARRNMELVQAAGQTYIEEIYKTAERGYLNGDTLATVTEGMKELTEGNVNQAKFWARDQLGDAYSEYNKQSQQSIGISEYIWRTVGDNHVRGTNPKDETSHVKLNGKKFTWAQGAAATGELSKPGARHPGEDYNCRCWPEPIIPGE